MEYLTSLVSAFYPTVSQSVKNYMIVCVFLSNWKNKMKAPI